MHELRMLRDKCARMNGSFGSCRYDADPCGDGFEVRLSTPSHSAVYRGPADECWEWLRGTVEGRFRARGSTMNHSGICDPGRLAPTGKSREKLIAASKRIWRRNSVQPQRSHGKSPAGAFGLSFVDGDDTCDRVYAFLCGVAAGIPQGEFEVRRRRSKPEPSTSEERNPQAGTDAD